MVGTVAPPPAVAPTAWRQRAGPTRPRVRWARPPAPPRAPRPRLPPPRPGEVARLPRLRRSTAPASEQASPRRVKGGDGSREPLSLVGRGPKACGPAPGCSTRRLAAGLLCLHCCAQPAKALGLRGDMRPPSGCSLLQPRSSPRCHNSGQFFSPAGLHSLDV
nr:translation initiation factor IF-2-like [Manis javanica]